MFVNRGRWQPEHVGAFIFLGMASYFRDRMTLKKIPFTRIRAILSLKTLKIRHFRIIEQNTFNGGEDITGTHQTTVNVEKKKRKKRGQHRAKLVLLHFILLVSVKSGSLIVLNRILNCISYDTIVKKSFHFLWVFGFLLKWTFESISEFSTPLFLRMIEV